jgi:predicted metalloprotease with PDZ domain
MGVDTTHAHLNMPATIMWADGHDRRAIRMTFVPPEGSGWTAGTQLFPTNDPFTFTAPNLQYLLDSPTELADAVESAFTVPGAGGRPATIRLFVHSDGSQADVDVLRDMLERLVLEQIAVYGEMPALDTGTYTFILDYVPWGDGDGMEHRNSTFISNPGVSVRSAAGRRQALGTISHEFFHTWNVERIRPVGLEPFDFTRENITCCLWLAEGFTSYYGPLLITRAGFSGGAPVGSAITVINGSGRQVRSAVQMSEHAPFNDAGVSVDRHDRSRTFISYYTYGAAIALALDLTLRQRSDGDQTLDDYMRLLWERHGKPGGEPGYVDRPYSLADARALLAELTGDQVFADEFFDRYVEGREVAAYGPLLEQAGFVMQSRRPGAAWTGSVEVRQVEDGLAVAGLAAFGTPAYEAGLDFGDTITAIEAGAATPSSWNALSDRQPGDTVSLSVRRRDGTTIDVRLILAADPGLVIVPVEQAGRTPTSAQLAFRAAWLGSKVR